MNRWGTSLITPNPSISDKQSKDRSIGIVWKHSQACAAISDEMTKSSTSRFWKSRGRCRETSHVHSLCAQSFRVFESPTSSIVFQELPGAHPLLASLVRLSPRAWWRAALLCQSLRFLARVSLRRWPPPIRTRFHVIDGPAGRASLF